MARRFHPETQNGIPVEEGQPIVIPATRARDADGRIFTCVVTVESSSGSGLGFGGKKTTALKAWDPSSLIEEVESLGWTLASVDHVWQQTEHNASLGGAAVIKGLTRAHMLFRRTATSHG